MDIVTEKLGDKSYNSEMTAQWTREISDEIKNKIKTDLELPRYKIVVQVVVGERWVAHARAGDARVGHVVLLMQPIVDLPGGRVADHQQRMRAEPLQHLSELGSHWR